jgi:hypothetical protein
MGEVAEGILARLMRAYDVHDENALAIQMGRDMSTVRVWKSRDSVPLLVLADAAKATGYSVEWFRGQPGAVERASQRTPDDDAARLVLSQREAQLIERYRSTDEDGRAAVELVTSTLATGGKPARPKKPRAGNPAKVGVYPSLQGGMQLVMTVREDAAPWIGSADPVRSDSTRAGGGFDLGVSALLPISSASESRPLVLTIKGGSAGATKDYEVIPHYTADASAGGGVVHAEPISQELDQAGEMAFSSAWLRDNLGHTSGKLASVRVRGDSMTPTLMDGETIMIDLAVRRVDVSGIYVIEAHGDRLVKRIDRKLDGSLVIISDNKAYPAEAVPPSRLADIKVIGRMVGRWQR